MLRDEDEVDSNVERVLPTILESIFIFAMIILYS